jgi:hypothetical protein
VALVGEQSLRATPHRLLIVIQLLLVPRIRTSKALGIDCNPRSHTALTILQSLQQRPAICPGLRKIFAAHGIFAVAIFSNPVIQ